MTFCDAELLIDLNAVKDNYLCLKKILGTSTECSAVVKANSYGLGAAKIAQKLAQIGCNKFFTATLDEAIELRKALPTQEIYVIHGIYQGQCPEFLQYALTPVLNDLTQIEIWNNFAKQNNLKLPALIHIDTGMARLGLTLFDALQLFNNLSRISNVNVKYIMSHLAAADEPNHPLNRKQLRKVRKIRHYIPDIPISFCNSSGIFLGDEYHFQLARPGMALYGLNPTPYQLNPMKQIIKLTAKILQLRELKTVSSVGYGGTYKAKKRDQLATISLGYADGYMRSLSNNSLCYIDNYAIPVVGRISMDLLTLDVTNVPEHLVHVGATVEIIGDHITVDSIASKAGTLSYEIITGLGPRIKRKYIG